MDLTFQYGVGPCLTALGSSFSFVSESCLDVRDCRRAILRRHLASSTVNADGIVDGNDFRMRLRSFFSASNA